MEERVEHDTSEPCLSTDETHNMDKYVNRCSDMKKNFALN